MPSITNHHAIHLLPEVRKGTTEPVFHVMYISLQLWYMCLTLTHLKEGNLPGVC